MFGARTPFGGGAFGSTSSSFGTQQTTPFASGSGLFGSKTPAPNTFGTPGFGSTPSSGGLFGGTSTGSNIFGAKTTQSGFGFTNTSSSGLFGGGSSGSNLFQTPQTNNVFGAKSTGFGFGSNNNTFGATSTGTGLFGGTSMFGQQATNGTTVKFVPVTSTEQTQKGGSSITVKTQNQCITVMDAYKDKSVEELRLEDYTAGRKGDTSSAFGSTAGTGLFGSTATSNSNSLFGNNAVKSTGFGGFGSNTGGGLFGQSSGGLFGAKTTSSLFGPTTTTTQSGFNFGGNSAGGLFGNTSSSGTSLFGNTVSAPQSGLFGGSGFGATSQPSTSNLFGGTSAFGQPASQSSSLFGSTKPGFGFGATSGTGFGTSNTLSFGGTSSAGGLFGAASKPAVGFGATGFGTTNTGFGFGNTSTSTNSLFGNTGTSNLFGNKPSGFGTTGFGSSTGTTGSLFGSGLGGNTTGFGSFGTSTQNTGLNFGGNSNFSGLPNVDQSTLAALRQQQIIQQQLKAIANTPFGDSPLFRNLTDSSNTKKSQANAGVTNKEPFNTSQYKVLSRPAKVKPRPISSPSLGKSRLFDGFGDEGDFSPHPLQPRKNIKKLVIKNNSMQDLESPSSAQLKFRSFTDNEDDLIAPSPDVIKLKTASLQESPIANSQTKSMFENTMAELNAHDKTPKLMKKTQAYVLTPVSPEDKEPVVDEGAEHEIPACKVILRRPEYYTQPSIAALDKLVTDGQCVVKDFTVGREGYGEVKFLGMTNVYNINLDNIVFFRRREVEVYADDYWNKPEVGKELNKPSEITLLKVWPNDKSSHTPVKTPERLKASGFIERIEEKTLAMDAVFIDYRPKEGAWVFKVNHFTRYGMQEEFISDEMENKMKRKMLQEESEVDFKREIFLNDEDIKQMLKKKIAQRQATKLQDIVDDDENIVVVDDNEVSVEKGDFYEDSQMEDDDSQMEDDDLSAELKKTEESMEDMDEEFMPLSHQLGRVACVKPFNLQGMKTSLLYDEEDEVLTPNTMLKRRQLLSNKSIFNSSYVDSLKRQSAFGKLDASSLAPAPKENLNSTVFQNVIAEKTEDLNSAKMPKKFHLFKSGLCPQTSYAEEKPEETSMISEKISENNIFVKCRSYGLVPYEQSLLFGKTALLADAGLVHSREFHVGWTNKTTFLHSGQSVGLVTPHTNKQTPSIFSSQHTHSTNMLGLKDNKIYLEKLNMKGVDESMKQFMEECLEISLKYSEFDDDTSSMLNVIKTGSVVSAISDYAKNSRKFLDATVDVTACDFQLHSCVWELVSALWGQQNDDTSSLYEVHAMRREALSKWLSQTVSDEVKKEVKDNRALDDGHLSVIFSLLSGKQVAAACKVARENKEIRLGFLLSQVCGDYHLKHYMRSQLNQWHERDVDVFMNPDRLKIYTLLSGMMVWKSAHNNLNLCKNLNWRRCLALHLWYYCSPTSTLFDALTEYQNSFKGTETYEPYSSYPSPQYEGDKNEQQTKDLCYHLIALYCKRSHSLEKMLSPKTHTANLLDYHISWHLHQVLDELGYNHMSDERHSFLQHNYASQLESIGMWHWSIFVLMHLRDSERREYYVKEVLFRYCRLNEVNVLEFSKEEELLTNKFGVPVEWIHDCKALHAKYLGKHEEEAIHLVRASRWNKAHTVILKHLAADAIIEEDYENLKELLQDVSLPERCCTVQNWKIGGQVFLDYILLKEKLEDIKSNKGLMNSYHLEDMEADIASLINRISLLKVSTARERLSQSEMARTCSNMLKIVFSLLNATDESNEENPKWSSMKVVPYVVELPLPPDYYLKELREILANFANEIEQQEGT